MSLMTRLRLGERINASYGREYLVVGCAVHIHRDHNTLHPCAKPVCESLEVTVVAPDKTNLELQEWFLSHSLRSGRLEHEIQDLRNPSDTLERHIVFEDAQCFSYHEHYDIREQSLRLLTLRIFPKTCVVDNISFIAEERE